MHLPNPDKSSEYLRVCQRTSEPKTWYDKTRLCSGATASSSYLSNRYRDVLAQDAGLVGLSDKAYINANFVKIHKDSYILCQAPLPATFHHHYAMIWQHQVFLSVMLTSLDEGCRHKADQYWSAVNETLQLEKDFSIKTTAELKLDGIITLRILEITHKQKTRQHYHLQYENWKDHSTPNQPNEIKALLSYIKVFTMLGVDKGYSDTKIIHCSAGIGRSGTLVACDQVSKSNISIPSLVERIRRQRLGAVQNLSQYQFIYSFKDSCNVPVIPREDSVTHKRCRLVQSN